MTNNEAKFILQAYRPNGADAGDATFQPSLDQAKHDATLAKWLEGQQKFDRAVADKLRSIEPPAGLREAILTGGGVSRTKAVVWWRRPTLLAMAASVLLLLSVGIPGWLNSQAHATEELPIFAADYVAGGFFLNQHNANVDELRSWLGKQHAPIPKTLPAGFAQLRSLGCKTIEYRGKEVSLICFGEGKEYHLFVARRDDFPMMPAKAVPQFLVRKGHAAAAWSDENNHYVVVTDDSLKALKQCLDCTNT